MGWGLFCNSSARAEKPRINAIFSRVSRRWVPPERRWLVQWMAVSTTITPVASQIAESAGNTEAR